MPSTRRQKAKSRRSREADIMSHYENMDIMLDSSRLGELKEDLDSFAGRSSQRDRENSNGITGNSSLENEKRSMSNSSKTDQQN